MSRRLIGSGLVTQKVVAIARLSDDSFWQITADIVVTLAACTEEVN